MGWRIVLFVLALLALRTTEASACFRCARVIGEICTENGCLEEQECLTASRLGNSDCVDDCVTGWGCDNYCEARGDACGRASLEPFEFAPAEGASPWFLAPDDLPARTAPTRIHGTRAVS